MEVKKAKSGDITRLFSRVLLIEKDNRTRNTINAIIRVTEISHKLIGEYILYAGQTSPQPPLQFTYIWFRTDL